MGPLSRIPAVGDEVGASLRLGWPRRLLIGAMRGAGRIMTGGSSGENALAVRLFDRLDRARASLRPGRARHWPLTPGAYEVGDPAGWVAVCVLSSDDLIRPLAQLPGVAIAGRLYTVNLGIERMLENLHANPRIRCLVLCGKDSPIFQTAQGVRALWQQGVTGSGRIIGALGHFPVLAKVAPSLIDRVRRRIRLIDLSGVKEPDAIADWLRRIERGDASMSADRCVLPTPAGGSPEPPCPDTLVTEELAGSDFFRVQADHAAGLILCQHYSAAHSLLSEERAGSASRIARGLIKRGALTDTAHAAYLGGELAKAEAALRLRLRYEQDRPLRLG